MHSEYVKATLCGAWILAICLASLATATAPVQLSIVFAGVAVVPLIAMVALRGAPTPIMASVREVRR